MNTGNEWNDLNVAVAAPTLMQSVAAKQSIKIRGLEPSRPYRAKITGDSHGLFLLEGGFSSERSENGILYFTPDARLEDVQIDIVSKGAFQTTVAVASPLFESKWKRKLLFELMKRTPMPHSRLPDFDRRSCLGDR